MLVKGSDIVTVQRKDKDLIYPCQIKARSSFHSNEIRKSSNSIFRSRRGEENAIESAVRTKMVEESPVDGIRALL